MVYSVAPYRELQDDFLWINVKECQNIIPLEIAVNAQEIQATLDKVLERAIRIEELFIKNRSDNDRLRRALDGLSEIAATIYNVADRGGRAPDFDTCQHGFHGGYPSSAWWCDDCFGELQRCLEVSDEARQAVKGY